MLVTELTHRSGIGGTLLPESKYILPYKLSCFEHTFRGEGFSLVWNRTWGHASLEAGQIWSNRTVTSALWPVRTVLLSGGARYRERIRDHHGSVHARLSPASFPWNILWYLRTEYGATSGDNGWYGLHVHFDKTALTRSEAIKFDLFYHRQQRFIELFSRRQNSGQYKWEKIRSYHQLGCSTVHDRVVSWRCKNTVEVRSFKGTLFEDVLLASVEFVDALIRFVKLHSIMLILQKHECLEVFLDHINHYDYWHLPDYISMFRSGVLHERDIFRQDSWYLCVKNTCSILWFVSLHDSDHVRDRVRLAQVFVIDKER